MKNKNKIKNKEYHITYLWELYSQLSTGEPSGTSSRDNPFLYAVYIKFDNQLNVINESKFASSTPKYTFFLKKKTYMNKKNIYFSLITFT